MKREVSYLWCKSAICLHVRPWPKTVEGNGDGSVPSLLFRELWVPVRESAHRKKSNLILPSIAFSFCLHLRLEFLSCKVVVLPQKSKPIHRFAFFVDVMEIPNTNIKNPWKFRSDNSRLKRYEKSFFWPYSND